MKRVVFLLVAAMFITLTANAQRPRRAHRGAATQNCMAVTMPKEDMNQAEKQTLTTMVQEEKMASDFYYAMSNKWNIPMFRNIMNAELRHKDILSQLLDKYDLQNPIANSNPGQYDDSGIQKLYNDLVAKGNASLKDALIAAAQLEEQDYMDLQKAIDGTDNADLRLAYQNLQRGAAHHLRAAVNQLSRLYGYTYEPQVLDKQTFDSLMVKPANRPVRRGPGMRR